MKPLQKFVGLEKQIKTVVAANLKLRKSLQAISSDIQESEQESLSLLCSLMS